MIAHRGELAAIATALLWTLSTLAWTSAGRRIGVVAVCVIRLVMAGVLLALYGQLTRGLALPVDATTRQWWILGLSGWFGFFVSDLCLFKAFQLIGPRLSLLLVALTPPAAAVIAWLFLAEPLAARQWLAMAMTLSGIVWVVLERRPPDVLPHPPGHLRLGVFLGLAAALSQALGTVLARCGIGDYDASAATFLRLLGGMAGYLVLVTLLGRWPRILAATRYRRAMGMVFLGTLVGPFGGVILFMVALRYSPAGIVSTIVATMPVLILPFSIFLYHERVSLRAAGGALVAVAGVALLML
ncbi:MAG: DMT family transporter [Thermoguttaceae bacterium]